MIANEHGIFRPIAFVFLEVVGDNFSIMNFWVASSKPHESHSPAMADSDRQPTLRTIAIESKNV